MARPTLIDACVPQLDGFRFVYTLPLDARRLLVEDTYFSDEPHLDVGALRDRALHHAASLSHSVERVVRVETGVLPLPLDAMPFPSTEGVLRAGYAGARAPDHRLLVFGRRAARGTCRARRAG